MYKAFVVAKYDLTRLLSSKVILFYVLSYIPLGVGIVYLGAYGYRELGLSGFGPIVASLVNFTLLLSGLMAIAISSLSIVGERERGFLRLVLAQPITRRMYMLGKFLSHYLGVVLATTAGFGVTALFSSLVLSAEDLDVFLVFVAIALAYLAPMSALGLFISVVSESRFSAIIATIATWFLFTSVYQLVITAVDTMLKLSWRQIALSALVNPVEAARLLYIYTLDPRLVYLGQVGVYFALEFGPLIPSLTLMSLGAWTLTFLLLALLLMDKIDL
jgi:ABC-2 type transporter.